MKEKNLSVCKTNIASKYFLFIVTVQVFFNLWHILLMLIIDSPVDQLFGCLGSLKNQTIKVPNQIHEREKNTVVVLSLKSTVAVWRMLAGLIEVAGFVCTQPRMSLISPSRLLVCTSSRSEDEKTHCAIPTMSDKNPEFIVEEILLFRPTEKVPTFYSLRT